MLAAAFFRNWALNRNHRTGPVVTVHLKGARSCYKATEIIYPIER
jgi:hypothetical protein